MQAVLLTASLLLVFAMIGSVAWLSAARPRAATETASAESPDDTV